MRDEKRRTTGIAIVGIILVFAIGVAFIIPTIVKELQKSKEDEIIANLENIYTSAIIVDQIEGGLHNDSDNAGKYEKLSELSGFRVHNAPGKNKYSLTKDYKTGEIVVRYGEKLEYPVKHDENVEVDSDNVQAEDLFTYDESEGRVIITGFSEAAISLLDSESVIQIPSTYKGRDVVEIAEKAFYNKNIMGTVIIPESIKVIGDSAFSNNGIKGMSNNIDDEPYAGSWKVNEKKWIRLDE